MKNSEQQRAYQDYIRTVNREALPDNEDAALAACDALNAEYNLDRYPTPLAWERLERSAYAAQTGGIFLSCTGLAPCRV